MLLGVDAAQMHMHMRMLRPRATVGGIFEVRGVELPANGGGRDGEAGVGGALSLWMAELLDPEAEGPHGTPGVESVGGLRMAMEVVFDKRERGEAH